MLRANKGTMMPVITMSSCARLTLARFPASGHTAVSGILPLTVVSLSSQIARWYLIKRLALISDLSRLYSGV
jgi:hypothetical protein